MSSRISTVLFLRGFIIENLVLDLSNFSEFYLYSGCIYSYSLLLDFREFLREFSEIEIYTSSTCSTISLSDSEFGSKTIGILSDRSLAVLRSCPHLKTYCFRSLRLSLDLILFYLGMWSFLECYLYEIFLALPSSLYRYKSDSVFTYTVSQILGFTNWHLLQNDNRIFPSNPVWNSNCKSTTLLSSYFSILAVMILEMSIHLCMMLACLWH